MNTIHPRHGEGLLDLAKRCGALYLCPKDGRIRKGPLVSYAGKDSKGRNLVGDIYFNFRRIECHPQVVDAYALRAVSVLREEGLISMFDTVCGVPQGGRTFGQALARIADKRFVYADKKPKPTQPGLKQEYEWDLTHFDFEQGERVAVAEDVFNNFQNTDNTLDAIAATGVRITALVGALNRSPLFDKFYIPTKGRFVGTRLPVVAAIRQSYPEYEQDDPEVAEDIASGNLEIEVKKNWSRLTEIMLSG